MNLTADVLRKWEACPEAITFLARNYPDGIDLSRYEIMGEYQGWIAWLRNKQSAQHEYDSRDNLVRKTYSDGTVKDYDSKGNLIRRTYPSGEVEDYDSRENLIRRTYPDGEVEEWKYDYETIYKNGKKICWLEEKR